MENTLGDECYYNACENFTLKIFAIFSRLQWVGNITMPTECVAPIDAIASAGRMVVMFGFRMYTGPARDDVIKWKHFLRYCSFVRISPVAGELPSQRPVTRSFGVFFDLYLDKRLTNQSIRRWFETPSCSLWRYWNAFDVFNVFCTKDCSARRLSLI